MNQDKGDTASLFEETKKEVTAVLSQYPLLEISGGKLYFLDKKGIRTLGGLKVQLEGGFTKKTDLKNYKFDLIVKLLNPARAAQNYFVGLKGKHRQINKSDTVRENIEGEFAVWKNKLKKDVREIVTLHSLDDEAFAILEKEAVMKIEAAEAQYNFILNHFDDLEVRIAGYTHEVIYPYVSYRIKGENIQKHLSIKVPSVLYYESVKYRSDMAVADFIKNATNAFGDIYYIEKEKTQ